MLEASRRTVELAWTRGAPSHAVSSAYWPNIAGSSCDGCLTGPLILRHSGGLGLSLYSGLLVQASLAYTQTSGLILHAGLSQGNFTQLTTDAGFVLCTEANGLFAASECAIGSHLLWLSSDGALRPISNGLGCIGVAGGPTVASTGSSAKLGMNISYCPGSAEGAVWNLWSEPYSPPGVAWETRTSSPIVQAYLTTYRWAVPLRIGLSDPFRGGFGLEPTSKGLSATNPETGSQVTFPQGAYILHAAWNGNTAFIVPAATSSEYDAIGDSLLTEWKAAFPSGASLLLPHAANQLLRSALCSIARQLRFGYSVWAQPKRKHGFLCSK